MISPMVSRDGDVPLLAKTMSGNEPDKTHVKNVLQQLQEPLEERVNEQVDGQEASYFVVDNALIRHSATK